MGREKGKEEKGERERERETPAIAILLKKNGSIYRSCYLSLNLNPGLCGDRQAAIQVEGIQRCAFLRLAGREY